MQNHFFENIVVRSSLYTYCMMHGNLVPQRSTPEEFSHKGQLTLESRSVSITQAFEYELLAGLRHD